ncbi:fumarate hydratase [Salipaludibacillus agaradhaerens]|uniref:fumarate hydratase n=1 Tax=Salipaludibacillus agaradhaerens TaxID=76935 RepID=UPI0009980A67|nr:fumarate hydratase [Salipaludibacillus agaradhaerens]MCR6105201.1 fumarate hydratase [Salipaludibacillus agaradhaerens]MCR6117246.1 fumarate hydratase [Salipaludibacillus agaradhaerens]UJW56440.1 fumarate hydratase [Bacillus sp. A116_S68]
MREISTRTITDKVRELCIKAAYDLPEDVEVLLKQGLEKEESDFGKYSLDKIIKNVSLARHDNVPMCQDTGITVILVRLGQQVKIVGGSMTEAINEGVRQGYTDGYLRKSVVADPLLNRVNTGDNTPAVIHTEVVEGDQLHIQILPKGAGSENMGAVKMCKPSEGIEGVMDFIVDSVTNAGGNPCPPIIVGVGIGGTMDQCTLLAKKALARHAGSSHPEQGYAEMEQQLLERINRLGIGPQGFGGRVTALAVHIETFPTHIAMLPVCVTLNCHAARHTEATL